MSLLQELFEPLFQRVCTISRSARGRATLDYDDVRADVRHEITVAREKAASHSPTVAKAFKRLEWPVTHSIDQMISANVECLADAWRRDPLSSRVERPAIAEIAGSNDTSAGDADSFFFRLLDQDLSDAKGLGADRAVIWHTCLCLAFVGPSDDLRGGAASISSGVGESASACGPVARYAGVRGSVRADHQPATSPANRTMVELRCHPAGRRIDHRSCSDRRVL